MAADFVVPELSVEPIVAALADEPQPNLPNPKAEEKKPAETDDEEQDMDNEKKAATFEQLEASCYGADAAFIVAQLKAKATVAQAQTAWMVAQNQRIAEANQRAEQAKAAATKPGVDPVVASGKKPVAVAEGEDFWSLVAAEQKSGRTKQSAIEKVVAKHPEAHRAMLEEVNANRKVAAR